MGISIWRYIHKFPDWVDREIFPSLASSSLFSISCESRTEFSQKLQGFCQCCKQHWNFFFEMAYRTVSGYSCISGSLWTKLPRWLSVWPGGTNSKWKIPSQKRDEEEKEDKSSQLAFVVDSKLPRFLRTRKGRYCPLAGLLFGFWDVTVNPLFISRLSDSVWLLQWLLNDLWNPVTHAKVLYLKVSVWTLIRIPENEPK